MPNDMLKARAHRYADISTPLPQLLLVALPRLQPLMLLLQQVYDYGYDDRE